jgi:hypothetical protein
VSGPGAGCGKFSIIVRKIFFNYARVDPDHNFNRDNDRREIFSFKVRLKIKTKVCLKIFNRYLIEKVKQVCNNRSRRKIVLVHHFSIKVC